MFHSSWCHPSPAGRGPGLITPSHSPLGSALCLLFDMHMDGLKGDTDSLLIKWSDDIKLRGGGGGGGGARIRQGPGSWE